jgi:transcriptional regulator with XRE-family HTH domain
MAALAGVADTTVARIERGDVDPSVGTLWRLLAVSGKSLTVVDGPGVASPTLPGVLGPAETLELHRAQVRDLLAEYHIVGALELPVPAEPDVL